MDKKTGSLTQKMQRFLKENGIILSVLGGYNCYELQDDGEKIREYKKVNCIHMPSGTPCLAVPSMTATKVWRGKRITQLGREISDPPESSAFEWPVDLAVYKNDGTYIYSLIYDMERQALKKGVLLKEILYQSLDSKVLDWRHEDIQNLIKSFLREMISFRKSGYLYLDYNIDKIYYCKEEQSFYFEFMRWTGRTGKIIRYNKDLVLKIFSKEFARPQIFRKDWDGTLGEYEDNFAITSMLFRLMIGRLPYEGKGMDDKGRVFHPEIDMGQAEYNEYFEKYHSYPCFIFDLNDQNNSLGPMVENDLPRERWEALPETVKAMFRGSLGREAAEKAQGDSYGPREWLRVIQSLKKLKE
ncbi:MAG: hypothetical protein Q4E24_01680 [bacterium]|nr:hypothetical protein [bacterium]